MFSYTATIGRNFSPTHPLPGLQNKPMSLSAWGRFVEDVQADMYRFAVESAIHVEESEVHYGKGVWDGVEEESAKITILTTSRADDGGLNILRNYLSENARGYGQDAIALTVGASELC